MKKANGNTDNPDLTTVLKEIAEEEIDEVDIIMEDISEEIKDLQDSISGNDQKKIIVSGNNRTNFSATDYNINIHTSQPHVSKVKIGQTAHLYQEEDIRYILTNYHSFLVIISYSMKMGLLCLTATALRIQV